VLAVADDGTVVNPKKATSTALDENPADPLPFRFLLV
jgi:hypothetical protein